MKPKYAALISGGVTLILSVGLYAAGHGIGRLFPAADATPLYLILLGALLLLGLINRISAGIYANRWFGMPITERQAFLDKHRADCAADPAAVMRRMGSLAVYPVTLLILYTLLTAGMVLAAGMAGQPLLALPGAYLGFMPLYAWLTAAAEGIRRRTLLDEKKLPHLHALARRAAKTVGVRGTVRLKITTEMNAEVVRAGRCHVVCLGTRLLAVATEEELYQHLLREFAYFSKPSLERRYLGYDRLAHLGGGSKMRPATWAFDIFISTADAHLEWELPLYNIALGRLDAAMGSAAVRQYGDPAADLSMEAKLEMWDYFDFEYHRYGPQDYYASPVAHADLEWDICRGFRRALHERWRAWSDMLPRRIPREGDIHPTFCEHRAAIGLDGVPLPEKPTFPSPDTPFAQDAAEAVELTVKRAALLMTQPIYDRVRKERYLDRLAIIDAWRENRDSMSTVELSPVLGAMVALNRLADLEALCDNILTTEPNPFARAFALYEKGICLLYRYDDGGIDYIYHAMDLNQNYMKDGLAFVEEYTALCGLTEAYDAYRARAAEMIEAHGYNQENSGSLSPADRLEKEDELTDELPAILSHMLSVSGGHLARIYLVRKVVSEDFTTSAFVLEFLPGVSERTLDEVYVKIYHYLDAYPTGHQFSLFIYDRTTAAAVARVPDSVVWERK